MKNKFYLILLSLIFLLSACDGNEKSSAKLSTDPNQNKQIQTTEKSNSNQEQIPKKSSEKEVSTQEISIKEAAIKKAPVEYDYAFHDIKKQKSILHVKDDIYDFKNIQQPIVITSIISTWCPPCRGQIPHLSKLQQKFKENLFIMGILVHDDLSTEALEKFIVAQKMLFYLSITQEENLRFVNMLTPKLGLTDDFPMPLTIVFVKGKYFTHYEGMVPEEMIESDIQHLVKKIKK